MVDGLPQESGPLQVKGRHKGIIVVFLNHLSLASNRLQRISFYYSPAVSPDLSERRGKAESMAAACCNFLQVPFSINPKPSPITPHRSSNPRCPFPHSLFSTCPPSPPLFSSISDNSYPSIDPVKSTVTTHPSLRYANVLFFRSAYNVQIVVNDDEPDEALLRRFRREVSKAGVIQECKRRRYFENTHEEKKRKAREASRRNRRR